jgi:hypothetical protein
MLWRGIRDMTSTIRKTWCGAFFGPETGPVDFEKLHDISYDCIQVYRPITSVGYPYIQTYGKQLQLVTECYDTVEKIAVGCFDAAVRDLARKIKAGGREVWIRQLHEFNYSDTYPWCIYRDGYTPERIETFKKAWRRLVGIYREEGAPVKFQWCLQATNPHGDKTPFASFYPGDDFVDQVGIDIYINPGSKLCPLRTRLTSNALYAQLAAFSKPIFIGEMSCTEIGLDKATWLREAQVDIARIFPAITIINFFFENKAGGRQWGLNSAEQTAVYVEGHRQLKQITSGAGTTKDVADDVCDTA